MIEIKSAIRNLQRAIRYHTGQEHVTDPDVKARLSKRRDVAITQAIQDVDRAQRAIREPNES